MVAEAFIPNPENNPCVNHKNGNKLDNNINNLEFCSYSENNIHAYRVLGKSGAWKDRGAEHPSCKPVLQIKDGKIIAEFYSILEAERRTGIDNTHISLCCKGKQKTSGGFLWKYK